MRIVGIDPGLEVTGYAVLDVADGRCRIVDAGIIRTNRRRELAERLTVLAEELADVLDEHKPEMMAVEELYSHYRFPRTGILMGHARGVILQAAAAAGMRVTAYSATRVKKNITGNGQASKQQIQQAVKQEFGLSRFPKPPDVADALAISLCCVNEMERTARMKEMAKR